AMWQLMMGGVFDRFPKLKLVLAEVYADWVPATIKYLDEQFEKNRKGLPARKTPSEYWSSNCVAGLSFIRKYEEEARHAIGLHTVTFGRDYPHREGTWPNTTLWLHEAFAGVPANEVKAILADNPINFFDLDRATLAKIANRIGLTLEEITGPAPAIAPALL